MSFNTLVDIIAWIFAIYWVVYIPNNDFSIDTHSFLATTTMFLLIWRCIPYIIVLDEYD